MKEKLQTIPFFVLLLPLFFVVHSFVEFLGFANFSNLVPVLITYLICSAVLFLIFRLLFRNWIKAALMTACMAAVYLFFGAIFDFLKANSPVRALYKYSVLLSILSVLVIGCFIFLWRTKKDLHKITLFLNTLLIIFIVVDAGTAIWKHNSREKEQWRGPANLASGIFPDSSQKPDIYLLLFDAYTSSLALKELWEFDNSGMDSFLVSRQFHLLPGSRANYDGTSFSMASMLNMDYLYWFNSRDTLFHTDYLRSTAQLANNEVIRVFEKNGYDIVNYSIFDMKGFPTPIENKWKSYNVSLLSEGTLGSRLIVQFRWWFERFPAICKYLPYFSLEEIDVNNKKSLKGVAEEAGIAREKPKFVYGHFLMPHGPFTYDKDGNKRPPDQVNDVTWRPGPDNYYTGYLQYTNGVIKQLVDTIRQRTRGKAVIILMGDHGYKAPVPENKTGYSWHNINAVYFPDKQYEVYRKMNDSITNVNQFRVLFNCLFHQQYPIMKDSSVFIHH